MPRHHRRVELTDSEDDYSESDTSMMEVPRHYRRRSVSRTRFSPSYNNTHLSPNNVLHEDVRIHRSASTGARRRKEERPPPPPPAVIVDIKNDAHNSNKNRKQRRDQSTHRHEENVYLDESEDETVLRRHRHRPRASTSSVSRSRDASPLHPAAARDYDMLIDQRLLERNDQRQDIELVRQQQEIERLERQLRRNHGEQEVRLIREEEDRYEVDISDRLRRLQRYEEQERLEEEKSKAERRYRLQRLEAAERESAEKEEVRKKLRHERLVELQRKIDEEEERERVKKEIKDEEDRIARAEEEKRQQEDKMKAAAIEEWKLNQERARIAQREAAERRDKEFKDRLRHEFGYTEEEIEAIINKKHKMDKKEEKEEKKEKKEEKKDKEEEHEQRKATWIKVHHKHLLPDTLIAYKIPWAFDELDGNYIIIKTWISEDLQEELFAHTRRLREGKVIEQTSSSLTELRVNDRNKDKMYLVRKKSPSRRSWIFT